MILRAGACALWLVGCATVPPATIPQPPAKGDASWRAVEAPGLGYYQRAPGEVSMGASISRRVNPIYPATQLGACPPPVEITALLIVDAHGEVTEMRVLATSPRGVNAGFADAARMAALQWRFEPLVMTHRPADAADNSHQLDSAAQPFSGAYVFHFECHAGQGAASANVRPAVAQ